MTSGRHPVGRWEWALKNFGGKFEFGLRRYRVLCTLVGTIHMYTKLPGGWGGVVFSMSRGSKMGVGFGVEVHFQNYLNLKEAELEKMKSDARHRHETVNR